MEIIENIIFNSYCVLPDTSAWNRCAYWHFMEISERKNMNTVKGTVYYMCFDKCV